MKKKILMFLSIAFLLLFTGCQKSYLKSIDYNQFKEKIDKKETFIVEVIQTGCSACKKFTPRYRKVINKYKITSYQLNYTNLKEDEKKEFDEQFSINSTPTVLFITKGEEKSVLTRIIGAVEEEKIISKFKTYGLIKEND